MRFKLRNPRFFQIIYFWKHFLTSFDACLGTLSCMNLERLSCFAKDSLFTIFVLLRTGTFLAASVFKSQSISRFPFARLSTDIHTFVRMMDFFQKVNLKISNHPDVVNKEEYLHGEYMYIYMYMPVFTYINIFY